MKTRSQGTWTSFALAADEAKARRVAVDGEGEGVGLVLRRPPEDRRGEHEQLVRDGADRRQHAGTADDDAVVVLVDDVRAKRPPVDRLRRTCPGRAVRLWWDERVRRQQIVLPHQLVVGGDVVAEAPVGLREPLAGAAQRHQGRVEVVPGPAEEAEAVRRPRAVAGAAELQIGGILRHEERRPDALPRAR